MPFRPAAADRPVHDADRDGNLYQWVLRMAAQRRAGITADLDTQRRAREEAARKFHEHPATPDDRLPIVVATRPARRYG